MNRFVLLLTLLVLGTSAKRSLRSLLLAQQDSDPIVYDHGICSNIEEKKVGNELSVGRSSVPGCYDRDLKKAKIQHASYEKKTKELGGDILQAHKQVAHQAVAGMRQSMKTLAGNCPWAPSVYGAGKIATRHAPKAVEAIAKLTQLTPTQFFSVLVGFIRGLFYSIITDCIACFSAVSNALETAAGAANTETLTKGLGLKESEIKEKPAPPNKNFFEAINGMLGLVKSVTTAVDKCSTVATSIAAVMAKIAQKIAAFTATAGVSGIITLEPNPECWFWHWIHRANEALASTPASSSQCTKLTKQSDCEKYGSCQDVCEWIPDNKSEKKGKCAINSGVTVPTTPGNCPYNYGFYMGKAIATITGIDSNAPGAESASSASSA